ncbi:MAG: DUF4136 domain-containing protein [Pseudomonadota bacterium]
MPLRLLLALTLLLGAPLTGAAEEPRRATPISMVHSDTRALDLAPGARVGWHEPSIMLFEDERFANQPISGVLRGEVARALTQRGLTIVEEGEDSDYLVGMLLAMTDTVSDDEILQRFGVLPGLVIHGEAEEFEKGTIVLTLLNPVTLAMEWRVVVQGFANLESTPQERRARVRHLVDSMLAPLP